MKSIWCLLLFLSPVLWAAEGQKFAKIGNLKLDNGEMLRDCVVGYRVFGNINA